MIRRVFVILVGLSLVLAGCVGSSTAGQPTQAPPTPVEPKGIDLTPTPGLIPVDIPPIQMKAIDALATALETDSSNIKVVSSESVDWPDSCLGISRPGLLCAQIVTPGFRIILESGGIQYEYRTSDDGSVVDSATLVVTWSRNGGIAGFCDQMAIFLPDGVYVSSCKGSQASGTLSTLQVEQLTNWVKNFGSVDLTQSDNATADSMTVSIDFEGQGTGQPDAAVQQQMFNLMSTIYAKIQPQM